MRGIGQLPEDPNMYLHPATVRRMIDSVAAQANQQAGALLKQIEALRQDVAAARLKDAERVPRFIEDIPGPRQPYTYVVKIPFTAGDTGQQQNSVTIATDGPFVCTSMSSFYKITDLDHALVGRWLPTTQLPFRIYNAGGPPAGSVEFSFRILTGGSGRQWASDWLPSPQIRGWGENPHYTGVKGWVDRANTLTVEARPEFAISTDGTGEVWFLFDGYQILTPVDLAKILGWHT